ncbi:MAG: VOC family protein [Pseudomonadota bacterium]
MSIQSLGYVLIESTDPDQWRSFGTEVLGLMIAPGMPDDGTVYLKADERPFRFAIVAGNTDRLTLCGWEMQDAAAFQSACAALDTAGVSYTPGTPEECRARAVKEIVRLDDPAGNTLELYWGALLDYARFNSPAGVPGFITGFNGDMGFGHAVLPAPNLSETHSFYRDVLGFDDTDYMHFHFSEEPDDPGQGLHFMHVSNPRHHSLALYQAPMPSGCVHLMLEVPNVDEVGYCLDRVLARNIPVTSTLGRHSNDRMLSFYMATPGGFALEYGCEGLQMDWEGYTPTVSALPSVWGHEFQMPE